MDTIKYILQRFTVEEFLYYSANMKKMVCHVFYNIFWFVRHFDV